MRVNIDKKLYDMVRKDYVSLEYVITEIIPTITMEKMMQIVSILPTPIETIPIELSEFVHSEIVAYADNKYNVDSIVNCLIAVGFILEV